MVQVLDFLSVQALTASPVAVHLWRPRGVNPEQEQQSEVENVFFTIPLPPKQTKFWFWVNWFCFSMGNRAIAESHRSVTVYVYV